MTGETPAPPNRRPRFSAAQMLSELATSPGHWRPRHGEIQDAFVEAIDPLIDLFMRSGGRGTGERHFAIRQVTARAINDLVVAVHLALHGYLNQAYNSLRMAIECMELRDLLFADGDAAGEWVNSPKPWTAFAPSAVRKRLQRGAYNDKHGLFSERSHPRFEASKLTGFMKRDDTSDVPVAVLRIGPFIVDDHPGTMEALTYAFDLAGQLTAESTPLVDVAPHVTARDLLEAVALAAEAIVRGAGLIEAELQSIGASGAQTVIDRHKTILDEVAAARAFIQRTPPPD